MYYISSQMCASIRPIYYVPTCYEAILLCDLSWINEYNECIGCLCIDMNYVVSIYILNRGKWIELSMLLCYLNWKFYKWPNQEWKAFYFDWRDWNVLIKNGYCRMKMIKGIGDPLLERIEYYE